VVLHVMSKTPCPSVSGCSIVTLERDGITYRLRVPADSVSDVSAGESLVFVPASPDKPAHILRNGGLYLSSWAAVGPTFLQ